MEQSPSWKANSSSCSQEIPRILWNPKIHYCFHKPPPPDPIARQIIPAHPSSSQILIIHFNIFLPFSPGSFKCALSIRSPHQNTMHLSCLPMYHMPCQSFFLFYHPKNIWWVHIIKPLVCSLLHSPVTSSLLNPVSSSAPSKDQFPKLREILRNVITV